MTRSGRASDGRHRDHQRDPFTVAKEEVVGTAWATPAEWAFPQSTPSRLKVDDPVLRQVFLERLVVTRTMVPVQFSLIEHWFRRRCSRGKMAERFVILLEQGISVVY